MQMMFSSGKGCSSQSQQHTIGKRILNQQGAHQSKRSRLSLISPELKQRRKLERTAHDLTTSSTTSRNLCADYILSDSLASEDTNLSNIECSTGDQNTDSDLCTSFLDGLIASGTEDYDEEDVDTHVGSVGSSHDSSKELKSLVIIVRLFNFTTTCIQMFLYHFRF